MLVPRTPSTSGVQMGNSTFGASENTERQTLLQSASRASQSSNRKLTCSSFRIRYAIPKIRVLTEAMKHKQDVITPTSQFAIAVLQADARKCSCAVQSGLGQ